MNFVTALAIAKRRFAERPFWASVTGTPLENDVPVIAAQLMQEAAQSGILEQEQRAREIAMQRENSDQYWAKYLPEAQQELPPPYTNNWRPMETAPKTGAQIIYRYMDGPYVRAGLMEWRFCADDDGQSCWWDVGIDDEPYKPTGWVPFPGGPAPEPHGLQKAGEP
jgi:hypothetical protein